jgi:hypothetical protein
MIVLMILEVRRLVRHLNALARVKGSFFEKAGLSIKESSFTDIFHAVKVNLSEHNWMEVKRAFWGAILIDNY